MNGVPLPADAPSVAALLHDHGPLGTGYDAFLASRAAAPMSRPSTW